MKGSFCSKNILEITSKLSVSKFFVYFMTLIFLSLLILFINTKSYGYASLTIYIILGISIFIIASNKFAQSSESFIRSYSTLSYICLNVFFTSFALSIVYLIFFEPLYSKSLYYYFFIGICTSALFITSVLIQDNSIKKLLPYLTLLLGFNILLSNFIVFPNGVYASGDTYYQIYNIALPIVENGRVPSDFSYSFFSIHQILVASLTIITGIEPGFLYMSVIGLLYVVSALFAYSLINRIVASKFAITAMLLFFIAPSIFYHGTHAYQFSYALLFAILLMYITIILTTIDSYIKNRNVLQTRVNWTILQILFIGVIIWTHQFTSTITFLLILIIWIIYYIISKNNISTLNNVSTLSFHYSVFFLYIVMLLAHWIYVSSILKSLVMVFNVYYNSLLTVENYIVASSSLSSNSIFSRPFWLIFLDMSGRGLFMMLGSAGLLYGMWKKNKYVFIWFTIGALIWIIISAGSFIKMPLLLGDRMLTLFEAMSIIYLAIFGIMLLIERFRTKGLIFCSILLFVMPIFSLGSTISGSETSLFIGDQPYIKLYDTNSDLQYRAWIKNTVPENSSIFVSEQGVPKLLDNMRIYYQLPINDQDCIADKSLKLGEYIVLNKRDCLGLRVRGISEEKQVELISAKKTSTIEAQASHIRMAKLDISEIKRVTAQLKHIYSNGETNVCLK